MVSSQGIGRSLSEAHAILPPEARIIGCGHVDGRVFTGLDGSEDWVADIVDINITESSGSRALGVVTVLEGTHRE